MRARRLIRDGLIVTGYLTGLPSLRRRLLVADDAPPSRILCFHRIVDVDAFAAKLAFIRSRFLITSLEGLEDPRSDDGKPRLAITFDDGYRSWFDVLPLLERFEIPATFFLCSGFLDCQTEEESLAFCASNLGLRYGEETLGWIGAGLLTANPLFSLGGHTLTHRNVALLSRAEAIAEIADDKRLLESRLEREVRYFAYPFGDASSYSMETAAIVRDAGYEAAMTLLPGINTQRHNRYELHRDCLDDVSPGLVMRSWLSGGYDWPNAIRAAVGRRRRGTKTA